MSSAPQPLSVRTAQRSDPDAVAEVCGTAPLARARPRFPLARLRPQSSGRALCCAAVALLTCACIDTGVPTHQGQHTDAGVFQAPLLLATWPADGAAGVPDELPRAWIAIASGGPLQQVRTGWRGPQGAVPHRAEERPCGEMGVEASVCLRLDPLVRLDAGLHQLGLDEGSLDVRGEPIEPTFAEFQVTALPVDPALPSTGECERDEERVAGFCLLRGDDSLRVRAFLTASAIVELGAAGLVTRALAERAEVTLRLPGLDPDTFYSLRVTATGLDGSAHLLETLVRTHPPLMTLTITEVLADPLGPDPAQEYVELLNYGEEPVPLMGLRLADDPSREGDLVTSSLRVPPGGRVLLVSEHFEPDAMEGDAPIPAGLPLVRLAGPIATGGLTNGGEPLFLRDAQNRRLAAVPALGGNPGRCSVRSAPNPRDERPEAFALRQPCTPGRAAEGETW